MSKERLLSSKSPLWRDEKLYSALPIGYSEGREEGGTGRAVSSAAVGRGAAGINFRFRPPLPPPDIEEGAGYPAAAERRPPLEGDFDLLAEQSLRREQEEEAEKRKKEGQAEGKAEGTYNEKSSYV